MFYDLGIPFSVSRCLNVLLVFPCWCQRFGQVRNWLLTELAFLVQDRSLKIHKWSFATDDRRLSKNIRGINWSWRIYHWCFWCYQTIQFVQMLWRISRKVRTALGINALKSNVSRGERGFLWIFLIKLVSMRSIQWRNLELIWFDMMGGVAKIEIFEVIIHTTCVWWTESFRRKHVLVAVFWR